MTTDKLDGPLKAQEVLAALDIPATAKTVGWILTLHWSKKSPNPFPSVKLLCQRTGLGKTAVQSATKFLHEAGIIRKSKRLSNDQNNHDSNKYDLSRLMNADLELVRKTRQLGPTGSLAEGAKSKVTSPERGDNGGVADCDSHEQSVTVTDMSTASETNSGSPLNGPGVVRETDQGSPLNGPGVVRETDQGSPLNGHEVTQRIHPLRRNQEKASPPASRVPPRSRQEFSINEEESPAMTLMRERGLLAPADWEPKKFHQAMADRVRVNLDEQAEIFKAHQFPRSVLDFDLRFKEWLASAKPMARRALPQSKTDKPIPWAIPGER